MTSEAQMKASRENAKKSTGPRTPEGKARASKNALKHGLMAQDAVIPGEDPAEFDRHLRRRQPRSALGSQEIRPGPSPAPNPKQCLPRRRIACGPPPTRHRLPVGQVSRPARRRA